MYSKHKLFKMKQKVHHEINILFIHAQDTLMTIMSELNMLETLGSVLLEFGQKIKDNEGK